MENVSVANHVHRASVDSQLPHSSMIRLSQGGNEPVPPPLPLPDHFAFVPIARFTSRPHFPGFTHRTPRSVFHASRYGFRPSPGHTGVLQASGFTDESNGRLATLSNHRERRSASTQEGKNRVANPIFRILLALQSKVYSTKVE